MKYDYDVKKMYFCKYDCPLKNKKLSDYIGKDVKEHLKYTLWEMENKEDVEMIKWDLDNYEFKFAEDMCEEFCPVDKFISQL